MRKYLSVSLIISVLCFTFSLPFIVKADDITSSVTVGNQAPSFGTDGTCGTYPCEETARYTAAPVNVGTSTTFRATGNDPNGEDYYLIVCKTDSFVENDSGAPSCGGGTICVSSATTDESAATCSYQALAGDDEEQAWYAKVCDANTTDQMCSATSQGNTGQNEATPLVVNHAPTVTSVSNDADSVPTATAPGQLVTFTSVADDPDNTSGDTIDLHVCNTNSFDGSACGDTELCSQTGQASNPTCQYQIPAGTDDDTSPYSAYAFIVDNHDFDPSVSETENYYVANVAPSILSVVTNGGTEISITDEYPATTNISFVATVQDNNGCADIGSPTSYVMYRSSVSGAETCSGNVNNCYTGDSGDYAVVCNSNSTCGAFPDIETVYTCTAAMQYHTDPTVANSQYAADTWISYFAIEDDDAVSDNDTATGVELDMLEALNSGDLSYGAMNAGDTDSTLTDSNTLTNTGNTALDAEVSSAAAMSDGQGHTIPVANQRADETSGTAWASAAVTLSGTLQEIEVDGTKTTISGSPETDAIYWGISIPSDQFPNPYSGSTTVAAKYSEVGQGW